MNKKQTNDCAMFLEKKNIIKIKQRKKENKKKVKQQHGATMVTFRFFH